MTLVAPTLYSMVVERPEPTDAQPQGLCLDKGYDYEAVRATLAVFGFTAHISTRSAAARVRKRAAGGKARRWVVERSHSWLNRFRRLLIRWEKSHGDNHGFMPFDGLLFVLCRTGLC